MTSTRLHTDDNGVLYEYDTTNADAATVVGTITTTQLAEEICTIVNAVREAASLTYTTHTPNGTDTSGSHVPLPDTDHEATESPESLDDTDDDTLFDRIQRLERALQDGSSPSPDEQREESALLMATLVERGYPKNRIGKRIGKTGGEFVHSRMARWGYAHPRPSARKPR